jgi:hypothetical protein
MNWRVAVYCRTEPEDETVLDGVKLWEQERHARLFVEDHPGWQITAVYDDRGASGLNQDRTSLKQLLTDARRHRFHIVLVMIPQVLSLSTIHYDEIVSRLKKYHIAFFTVYEG